MIMSKYAETRYLIVAEDGRYVTLGRAYAPTPEEVEKCSEGLVKQGLGGWYAIMRGDYWGRREPTLEAVQEVGMPITINWEAATASFRAARAIARGVR
jgi:hypothetical protein